MSRTRSFGGLVFWLAVCYGAGWFASQFSPGTWYENLLKPDWTPPAWVFGPAWAVLYTLMAVSAWLVWRKGGFRDNVFPLGVFLLQLLANVSWPWVFFSLNDIGLALVNIIVLDVLIILTMVTFWKRVDWAGDLLIPYLVWTLFATALNGEIWSLNP